MKNYHLIASIIKGLYFFATFTRNQVQQGACDVPDYFMYDHVCKVSFWQEADKLTKQKVRFEQGADIVNKLAATPLRG